MSVLPDQMQVRCFGQDYHRRNVVFSVRKFGRHEMLLCPIPRGWISITWCGCGICLRSTPKSQFLPCDYWAFCGEALYINILLLIRFSPTGFYIHWSFCLKQLLSWWLPNGNLGTPSFLLQLLASYCNKVFLFLFFCVYMNMNSWILALFSGLKLLLS